MGMKLTSFLIPPPPPDPRLAGVPIPLALPLPGALPPPTLPPSVPPSPNPEPDPATTTPVALPTLFTYLCPKLLEYRFLGGIGTGTRPSSLSLSPPAAALFMLFPLSLSELAALPLVPGLRSPRLEGVKFVTWPCGDGCPALNPLPIGDGGSLAGFGIGDAEDDCLECIP